MAAQFFQFATCECSRRTAEEEARLGSYCADCWCIIKNYNHCVICNVNVKDVRLYVDLTYKLPTCDRHFPAGSMNGVQSLEQLIRAINITLLNHKA